jgi:hypothetical protein
VYLQRLKDSGSERDDCIAKDYFARHLKLTRCASALAMSVRIKTASSAEESIDRAAALAAGIFQGKKPTGLPFEKPVTCSCPTSKPPKRQIEGRIARRICYPSPQEWA